MKWFLFSLLLCLILFTALSDARKGSKKMKKEKKMAKGNGKQRDTGAGDCGPWVWGNCNAIEGLCGFGLKTATRDGAACKIVSKTKRCRIPCEGDRPKKECKYEVGEAMDCDPSTGSRNVIMRLTRGDPETCPEEKTLTKKCKGTKGKKACKYDKGQWGLCDTLTDTRVRLDMLIESRSDPDAECAPERVIVKKCRFACKYDYEDWSECDVSTNSRSRVGVLNRKKNTPADCEGSETQTRNCFNKKGKEKCFFGPWERSKECVNGERTKEREVLAGGKNCDKRAKVTRKCKEGKQSEQ